ncbi:MAG: helix-turn-helix domain-containing protein [Bacillus sp. (in: Bacteria)]|nr:helix-turn-helix domain-containing protein [Bacillus sp. (in: firmicutes)]MCM1426493.1 helix-turn-helix domain-containing protein [Eubacterium sp.]
MVSYAPFFHTLKEKKISIYTLVHKKGINANTINCIKKGKSITTYTLNNLCKALDCQIFDIIEYIPDKECSPCKVLDIFSWLPAKEISLERLEQIFMDYKSGSYSNEYDVSFELPGNITENILNCKNKLLEEGKSVAYILKEENVIAVIGYRE